MHPLNAKGLKALAVAAALGVAVSPLSEARAEGVVNVYNWSDYIAEDTIEKFEAETGIEVKYDVFDSNEVLEAKLLAGNTGYDVVVPSGAFLERQIKVGIFTELDRSKLPNWDNLDPDIMKAAALHDPGNQHAVVYLWGTTGIGYNVDKVKEALGADFEVKSWDMLFKPENAAKLADCGVYLLDAPSEVVEIALNYMGLDPFTEDPADYAAVEEMLLKIRPYVTKFHSSEYINALANGDICVALGWSGDVLQAAVRAEEVGNGQVINYVVPEEGTISWFDMMAIPADAPHPENAYKFIDFIMKADIAADITNYVAFANANEASMPMIDEEVRNDPRIFPSKATKERLFADKMIPQKVDRIRTRLWNKFKTGI
ncbi:polyamine ABC transporter substrate-binding protein [Roseospirillum parvum]|nr:polyamine ABC transporter substrate-binding protein [Roseospirillum parvum]